MRSNLQTISLPRAIKPEHCFKDIETEGILPDYSPDISRLVRVDASPYVENVKCDEMCEISGRIVFGLLYESDYKSKLAYTTFASPFSLKCDISPARETYPRVKCDCTYLTCRLLGQRKVSVKAKIDAVLSGTQVDDMTFVKPDIGDLNTFFKTTVLNASIPAAKAEAVAEIKENIVLEEPVSSVIYAQAAFSPSETETYDTSAAVRSTMNLNALCELPTGDYKMFERKIPVEVSLKNDMISGDSTLDADMDDFELSAVADLDEFGENKLLNVRCTVRASATVRKNQEITLPLDAFSRKHSCKCETGDVTIDINVPQSGKTVSVERSHVTDGDLTAALGSSTSIEITETHNSGNMIFIKGRAKTDVLAKSGDSVVSRTYTDDFEDTIPFVGDVVPVISDISVFESKAELYGDNMNIRITAFVNIVADEHKRVTVLTSVELGDTDEPVKKGIRFYYPDDSETVWDIAKKYRVDPDKLQSDNAEHINDEGKLIGRKYIFV